MGGHGFMSRNGEMHLLNEKDHTFVCELGRRLGLVLHKSVKEASLWGVCEGIGLLAPNISHVKGLLISARIVLAPLLLIPPINKSMWLN